MEENPFESRIYWHPFFKYSKKWQLEGSNSFSFDNVALNALMEENSPLKIFLSTYFEFLDKNYTEKEPADNIDPSDFFKWGQEETMLQFYNGFAMSLNVEQPVRHILPKAILTSVLDGSVFPCHLKMESIYLTAETLLFDVALSENIFEAVNIELRLKSLPSNDHVFVPMQVHSFNDKENDFLQFATTKCRIVYNRTEKKISFNVRLDDVDRHAMFGFFFKGFPFKRMKRDLRSQKIVTLWTSSNKPTIAPLPYLEWLVGAYNAICRVVFNTDIAYFDLRKTGKHAYDIFYKQGGTWLEMREMASISIATEISLKKTTIASMRNEIEKIEHMPFEKRSVNILKRHALLVDFFKGYLGNEGIYVNKEITF